MALELTKDTERISFLTYVHWQSKSATLCTIYNEFFLFHPLHYGA